MYKNYLFDLYGTLIDINTDERQKELWEKLSILYRYKGADYTADEIMTEYVSLVDEEKKLVRKRHPEYTYIDIKIEKVFKKLFIQKGVRATKSEIAGICTAFRCYSTVYIKLYDGVTDLLDTLKSKGKGIYLLSNAQRGFTVNELNMFGLTKYFDAIVISSDEECSKPDRHLFDIIIERYNLDRKRTIMVGNDYLSDIQGAKEAGLESLYIQQSISPPINGILSADYKAMDGNVYKIKELIVK